ncbi:hypothetical protein ACTG0T_04115 [Halococcus morrhuae DSM 1307]|uniref:hypothetical protein n=1 Tax=Halococcus morrhuae TaxID=2250 RepID=UPI000A9858E0|nr:hypothetical protein [Halococcus morrhuae]
MAVPSRLTSADDTTTADSDVSIHSTSLERSVFIEADNADGWISTDTTVPLER